MEDKKALNKILPWIMVLSTLISIAALPEYIAPFVILAYFPFFVRSRSIRGKKTLLGDTGKMMLTMICYMMLTAIWSTTHFYSVLISLLWAGMLLCSCLISNTVDSENALNKMFYVICIASGVISLIAILEVAAYYLKLSFPNPFWSFVTDVVMEKLPLDIVYKKFPSRASSTFDNPLTLATYLTAALPMSVHAFFLQKDRKKKIVAALCCALTLGGIFCTFSRGAMIAVCASLLICLLRGKKQLKIVLPAIFGVGASGIIFLFVRYSTRINDLSHSNSNRIKIWEACGELFTQKPVFGWGAGNQTVMNGMKEQFSMNHPHAHNLYLELMCEGGIICIAMFIAVLALVVKNLYKMYRCGGAARNFSIAMASSFIGFLVMSMTEYTLQSPRELMWFMSMLGIVQCGKKIYLNKIALENSKAEKAT